MVRIEKAEVHAKADGVVTGQERKHLLKMENHESKAIYSEKHGKQPDLNHDGRKDHPQARATTAASTADTTCNQPSNGLVCQGYAPQGG